DHRYNTFSDENIGYEEINHPVYRQVFSDKFDFIPNLSILDLLFNKGPETLEYLEKLR
ncbi:WbqC family protein, partial [Bacteroidota bacterium]